MDAAGQDPLKMLAQRRADFDAAVDLFNQAREALDGKLSDLVGLVLKARAGADRFAASWPGSDPVVLDALAECATLFDAAVQARETAEAERALRHRVYAERFSPDPAVRAHFEQAERRLLDAARRWREAGVRARGGLQRLAEMAPRLI